jgi:anaerobic magnesium-protoporphyrin IX monomethyl ester cyclase
MKKGLLISPPARNQRVMNLIPSGLLAIGGYLKKYGYEIKVYDSGFPSHTSYSEKIEKTNKIIKEYAPDFIGLGFPTEAFDSAVEIAKMAKESDKDMVVIVGGIHPTAKPEETLSIPFFDFLVHGEGEITTQELLDAIIAKRDLTKIKGISYKKDGKILNNDSRPEITNVDDIPFDNRDLLIDSEKYPKEALGQIHTSRGCSYNCAYCSSSIIWGEKVRFRSVTNVIEEINYLYHQYRVKDINFADDNFLLDPERVRALCDEILNRRLKINWRCCARADIHRYFNADLLKLMHKAGCKQICIGFESGSQKLLDAVNRGVNLTNIKETIKMMNDAHIKLHADFIIGLPGETETTLKETFDLMKLVWDWCRPTTTVVLFKPYPGTTADELKELIDYKGLQNGFKKIFNYAELHNVRRLTTEPGYIWDGIRKNISSPKKFGSSIVKFLKAWL